MYKRRKNIEIDFFLVHKIGHKELKSIVQFSFHNVLTLKKNKSSINAPYCMIFLDLHFYQAEYILFKNLV